MKNEKWKIHAVMHTHWDKEWYFTKQESDVHLIDNIDKIIEIFQNKKLNYTSFTYDGQVSIIDDYLRYKPERKKQLVDLINNKKLLIGPWYSQPDLFNITSESIVRNILVAKTVANKYGISNLINVGYLPDTFGHNAQLPQILNKFEIKNFIYWRGISKKQLDTQGVFSKWIGIDGNSNVGAYNFLLGYWAIGSFFPYEMNENQNIDELAKSFLDNSKNVIDELKKHTRNTNNIILLPIGGDQAPINGMTPKLFEAINRLSNDKWIMSNYDNYFEDLKLNNIFPINSFKGELKNPFLSRIHKTIGSQRYDIKRKLKEVEYLLYMGLEPLATFWKINDGIYPQNTIHEILKLLLTCQAHDSAGGCNSDRTNSDILNRLWHIEDLINSEITKILKNISIYLNVSKESFIIFNTKLENFKLNKELKIFSKLENFKLTDINNNIIKFDLINSIYHNGGKFVTSATNGELEMNSDSFYEHNIIIYDNLEPYNLKQYFILKEEIKYDIISFKKELIENENLKIQILNNGKIIIKNKLTNVENLFSFIAVNDCGDSYDFSPKENDYSKINKFYDFNVSLLKLQNFEILKVVLKFEIPTDEKCDKKIIQDIFIDIKLNNFNIDFNIELKNLAKNIKWICSLDMNDKIKNSFANQSYHLIERSNLPEGLEEWENENWKEKPVNIETNESFVYVKNKNQFAAYLTYGNNEYEIYKNEFRLTLFRSIEYLGKNDLLWRPGRASGTSEYQFKTPDALMNKEIMKFNFSLVLREPLNIFKEAQNFVSPIIYYQNQKYNNLYKKMDRFLILKQNITELKNKFQIILPDWFVITAIKKSEIGNEIIFRGFNSSNKINIFSIKNKKQNKIEFCELLLNENRTSSNYLLTKELCKYEIFTFRIKEN